MLPYCQTMNNDDNMIPGKDPFLWSSRVQIALDSGRGLEYIHEHTVPVYIHRDVKSANILIDKNIRGKVALLSFFMTLTPHPDFSYFFRLNRVIF